jgi:hypothetical protein
MQFEWIVTSCQAIYTTFEVLEFVVDGTDTISLLSRKAENYPCRQQNHPDPSIVVFYFIQSSHCAG